MRFGTVVFFVFVVLLILGAYYMFTPAQSTVDSFNSQQDGVLSRVLAEAPGFIEWFNDRFRLFAIFVVFLGLALGLAVGKSETHGLVVSIIYIAGLIGTWYAGSSIGNWFAESYISAPPETLYALKLCLLAWTLPFGLAWLASSAQSGGSPSAEPA